VDSGVARPHRVATAAAHGHRRQTRQPTRRSRRSGSPPQARCSGSWTKAIHVHGAAGLSRDFPLQRLRADPHAAARRADPDEVHKSGLARNELRHQAAAREHRWAGQATLRSHSGLVVTHSTLSARQKSPSWIATCRLGARAASRTEGQTFLVALAFGELNHRLRPGVEKSERLVKDFRYGRRKCLAGALGQRTRPGWTASSARPGLPQCAGRCEHRECEEAARLR